MSPLVIMIMMLMMITSMSPDQAQNGMNADGERFPLASMIWAGWFA